MCVVAIKSRKVSFIYSRVNAFLHSSCNNEFCNYEFVKERKTNFCREFASTVRSLKTPNELFLLFVAQCQCPKMLDMRKVTKGQSCWLICNTLELDQLYYFTSFSGAYLWIHHAVYSITQHSFVCMCRCVLFECTFQWRPNEIDEAVAVRCG